MAVNKSVPEDKVPMSLCVSIVTQLTVRKTHVAVNTDYLPDRTLTLQVTIQAP
jgi:hypothetical protein